MPQKSATVYLRCEPLPRETMWRAYTLRTTIRQHYSSPGVVVGATRDAALAGIRAQYRRAVAPLRLRFVVR